VAERDIPYDMMTVAEAAQWAGVTPVVILSWIARGLLPSTRVGRQHQIQAEDVAAAQQRLHAGTVVPVWRADPRRAGARLRALRAEAGLDQQRLARRSGLTHEAISNLEAGKRAPHAATVRALAAALGVEPERFVGHDPIGLKRITVAEAAARLGVPAARVQVWMKTGVLPGEKVSGDWRVLAVAVEELNRSGRLRGASRRLDPRYRG